jgi:hypothetical protein
MTRANQSVGCEVTTHRALEASAKSRRRRTCLFADPGTLRIPRPLCSAPFTLVALQRLGDVGEFDEVGAFEVGDGADGARFQGGAFGRR